MFPLAAQVGLSALGGLLNRSSAKKAARAREQAYNEAGTIVGGAYDEAAGYLDPRAEQEREAMARVSTLLGLPGGDGADPTAVLRSTPGYEFMLDQGIQARERSAAARGGLNSGNTLAALEEYGQGLADSSFQQYLANVMGLQNQGVDSALAGMRVDRGNALADLRLGRGGARASGYEARGSALSGAISGVARGIGGGINPLAGAGGGWRRPRAPVYDSSGYPIPGTSPQWRFAISTRRP